MRPSVAGEIIKNGVLFDMKNWSGDLSKAEQLPVTVARLFQLLETRQIHYLLVGGIALLSYVEGRNTQDIDFILSREDLRKLPEISLTDNNKDFARGTFEGLQIDFWLTDNELFDWVRSQYGVQRPLGQQTIRISSVEGLLLLKLYALPSLYRQGNFDRVSLYESDIVLLLLNYSVNTTELLAALSKHILATDFQEVQHILTDLQTRVQRLRESQAKFKRP